MFYRSHSRKNSLVELVGESVVPHNSLPKPVCYFTQVAVPTIGEIVAIVLQQIVSFYIGKQKYIMQLQKDTLLYLMKLTVYQIIRGLHRVRTENLLIAETHGKFPMEKGPQLQ